MAARYRRPPDPRTRSRDSYEGMRILVIILTVWSFGFLWLSVGGVVPWISGNYTYTACCNVVDFCLLVLMVGILLRFRKEERMKHHITEHLKAHDSITRKELAEAFTMNHMSASKVMYDWDRENPGIGTHDAKTGIIVKNKPE